MIGNFNKRVVSNPTSSTKESIDTATVYRDYQHVLICIQNVFLVTYWYLIKKKYLTCMFLGGV